MVKARALYVFFPLAFLFSWYGYLLAKIHWVREGGINPLGPMVAAIITAAIFYRWRGVKELLGRYLRWRLGWQNWAIAVGLPIALVVLAGAINVLLGAARPEVGQATAGNELLPRFLFALIFIGIGEETGWRGFALPELQKRFSPLTASLILGVIWAAWHIPLMGTEFAPNIVPIFIVSVMCGSVVTAWLLNRTQGSLVLLPLFHATVNTAGAAFVFRMFHGPDVTRLWWIYTALWVVVAAGIALISPIMRAQAQGEGSGMTVPVAVKA